MYTCKITTIIALLALVSCNTPDNKSEKGPIPKPITVNQTDIIKTDFPKVDYAN
jgi:hypothetical protein